MLTCRNPACGYVMRLPVGMTEPGCAVAIPARVLCPQCFWVVSITGDELEASLLAGKES